jgi:hypothetical protein
MKQILKELNALWGTAYLPMRPEKKMSRTSR